MLTPLDIESKSFKKGMGYNTKEVDSFLKEITTSYEKIYKENIELKDKVNVLNEGIQYYKTIEETLQNTLVLAEKTAEDVKSTAYSKAEQIEKEAELKAEGLLQEARNDLYRIHQKIEGLIQQYHTYKIQIKQQLKAQIELLENQGSPLPDLDEQKGRIISEDQAESVDEEA